MKIFIDFDDVMFNTKQFSPDLKLFFQTHGISENLFKKYYYTEKEIEVRVFDPWGIMDRVEQHEGIDMTQLRGALDNYMKNLSRYVFEDVRNFCISAGRDNVYIISYGLKKFQDMKIIGSGVHALVKKVVSISGSKSEEIKHIIESERIGGAEQIFFLDDRAAYIAEVKKEIPRMVTLIVKRPEGRYADPKEKSCNYEVHNLEEAMDIIRKIAQK